MDVETILKKYCDTSFKVIFSGRQVRVALRGLSTSIFRRRIEPISMGTCLIRDQNNPQKNLHCQFLAVLRCFPKRVYNNCLLMSIRISCFNYKSIFAHIFVLIVRPPSLTK